MSAPFTIEEKERLTEELRYLYVNRNKSLSEIAKSLKLSEGGVYKRLKRFKILTTPWLKKRFCNKTKNIVMPVFSPELAELVGIMLGDGQITNTQIWITSHLLDDRDYHHYIKNLIAKLFSIKVRSIQLPNAIAIRCYVNSVDVSSFFAKMGLVKNKVKEQVAIPQWIFTKQKYQKTCLKGLIDTDGSVYKLNSGSIQISFKNFSLPLLMNVRKILTQNGFHPSKTSSNTVYLTRRDEIIRYFKEIKTSNPKHLYRYLKFLGGSHSGNCTRL